MDFSDGDDLFYERLMRRSPGRIPEPEDGRSCRDCAYLTYGGQGCELSLCPFDMTESEGD